MPEYVEGNEAEEMTFAVFGDDPDGDELFLDAFSEDLPEGWTFSDIGDGSGALS